MANTIRNKNSSTATNVPASLQTGELAVNHADRKVFLEGPDGTTVENVFAHWLAPNEVSVASAATTNIGGADGLRVAITGTTTITSFGTVAHRLRHVRFSGALTLTHNATSLILPTGANITTAAGDTCMAISDGSGNWRVHHYTLANGRPLVAGVPTGGTAGQALVKTSGTDYAASWTDQFATLVFVIDGAGSAVSTGVKGDLQVPFACTITEWTLLADTTGSVVVDVWKDTYANYPPVVGDSITASAKPTISSSNKGNSSTLTGWTTTVAAGDILRFNVDSASTITRVSVNLRVRKT